MAKKKKSSLAPVNRGFATISQPKKPVPVVEEPEEPVPEEKEGVAPIPGVIVNKDQDGPAGQAAKDDGADDWESEYKIEEGIYQGYVERLQEKGEKEINRIIKAIDFDKRMNKGYIHLDLEESLRAEVIDLNKTTTAAQAEPLRPTTNQQEKEKTLLKLYINFGVLTRLGYEEEQVLRCLEAIGEKGGWEEGLDWLLLKAEKQ